MPIISNINNGVSLLWDPFTLIKEPLSSLPEKSDETETLTDRYIGGKDEDNLFSMNLS